MMVVAGAVGIVALVTVMIFRGAFNPSAVVGGAVGVGIKQAITKGVGRGIFSNEAGLGSAPIAHAAADTDSPVRQGLFGVFEVFADTIVICTLTALTVMCAFTGNDAISIEFGKSAGANLAITAFSTTFGGKAAGVVVAVGLTLFALSTVLSWGLYGTRCAEFLFGTKIIKPYQVLFCLFMNLNRDELLRRLVEDRYERNDIAFERNMFRVRGDTVEIYPAYYKDKGLRVEFFGDEIDRITEFNPVTGAAFRLLEHAVVYPASHYVTTKDKMDRAIGEIRREMEEQVQYFTERNKLVEAQRIRQRTEYDIEMMTELGYCSGIENYSRIISERPAGSAPMRAADYLIDVGPGAGIHGGEIVAAGTPEEVMANPKSLTGQYLSGKRKIAVPETRRTGSGNFLKVIGAEENNLKNVDVAIPLGTFTCVTGVSGSGKSSLVNEILFKKLGAELMRMAALEMSEALQGFIEDELADRRYYMAFSCQAPGWARQTLRDTAEDEGGHARRLMAVYYLITGQCYQPAVSCERICVGQLCPALRTRYHVLVAFIDLGADIVNFFVCLAGVLCICLDILCDFVHEHHRCGPSDQ